MNGSKESACGLHPQPLLAMKILPAFTHVTRPSLHQQVNPYPSPHPSPGQSILPCWSHGHLKGDQCSGMSPTTALYQTPSALIIVPAPAMLSASSGSKGFPSGFAQTSTRNMKMILPFLGTLLASQALKMLSCKHVQELI